MGLCEYTIYIIPEGISYVYNYERNVWRFDGISNIKCDKFIKDLVLNMKLAYIKENFYTDNKCIDIRISETGGMLKSLSIQACIPCFDAGLEECYKIAKYCNDNIFHVRFNVLGENIDFCDYENFKLFSRKQYSDKLNFLLNGELKEFKYVIPPHDFYRFYKKYRFKIKIRDGLRKIFANKL